MDYKKFSSIYGAHRTENCHNCVCYTCKRSCKVDFCKTHCDMCVVVEGNGKRDKCLYEYSTQKKEG